MKTIKTILLLLLISLLNTGYLSANTPDPDVKLYYTQLMNDEVRSLVSFPQFARDEGLQGFVLISFDYDETGDLHVIEVNSNSDELKDYVITRLTELDLCSHARKPGLVYYMRFDFRLI